MFMIVFKMLQKIHPESYLRCQRCGSPNPLTERVDDAPHPQLIMSCPKCNERMRVPVVESDITVRGPHCKTEFVCEKVSGDAEVVPSNTSGSVAGS
jgi:NAD-dependent SIR2 family protein deacetylase